MELTVLNLTLLICHVLKVVKDGASGEVMEGLIPQLFVNFFLTFPAVQVGLDVEDHLPLHCFPT